MILIGIVGLCLVAILWVLLYLYFIRRTDRFMENWEREIKEKAEKSTLKSIQSLEEVAKAIETLPESIQSLEEAAEAIKASRKAMEKFAFEKGFIPEPSPQEITIPPPTPLGKDRKDKEKIARAIEICKKEIELNPDSLVLCCNLGKSYCKLGRYKEAIEIYKKAIELNPDSWVLWNNLGTCYFKLGRYKEVEETLTRAIELWPDAQDLLKEMMDLTEEKSQKETELKRSYKEAWNAKKREGPVK
jgi:tetratricopeptide (TPR) repeat protein